ncbi:hypothetical protein ACFX2C_028786 [Malus domestica]
MDCESSFKLVVSGKWQIARLPSNQKLKVSCSKPAAGVETRLVARRKLKCLCESFWHPKKMGNCGLPLVVPL